MVTVSSVRCAVVNFLLKIREHRLSRINEVVVDFATISRILLLTAPLSAISQVPMNSTPAAQEIIFSPVLEPGCLLPPEATLRLGRKSYANLLVQVDEAGKSREIDLESTTGNATLDLSLIAAISECKFTPAFRVESLSRRRVQVPSRLTVRAFWPPTGPVVGVRRCVFPDYPHAARRLEETGDVTILYRIDSASGKLQITLHPESAPLRILRNLSLRTVSECLSKPGVTADLPTDEWLEAKFAWRLH